MKREDFLQSLEDMKNLINEMDKLYPDIKAASGRILSSIKNDGKLMICGNGGSAADAQHMAAEFVNRFLKERRPLPALALSTDTSNITSIANDYSFNEIFSKQIEALGKKQDVLINISTSGNSKNVLEAAQKAKEMGIFNIGILGKDGGTIKDYCDISITVHSNSTPRIQEMHIFIIHTICQLVEEGIL